MASASLSLWLTEAIPALDEIAAAHRAVGGRGRGRRWTTQQINYAYLVILASRFQQYCRNVHSEAADHVGRSVSNPNVAQIVRNRLADARWLDRGNANPGNLGADFHRFGFALWEVLASHDPSSAVWQASVQSLNEWRNAIVHQDFARGNIDPRGRLRVSEVLHFRRACERLVHAMDVVIANEVQKIVGSRPW